MIKSQITLPLFINFLKQSRVHDELRAEIAPMSLEFAWENFSLHPRVILDDGSLVNHEDGRTNIDWATIAYEWRELTTHKSKTQLLKQKMKNFFVGG